MATTINKTERAIAGSGYIISFFSELEILLQNAANYVNGMAKMKDKYGKIGNETEIDQRDAVIINITENFKSSVFKTWIKFTALKKKVREFQSLDKPDKNTGRGIIEELQLKIRKQSFPEVDDAERYVLELNTLFVEALDVLTTAQTIYQSMVTGQAVG